MPPEVAAAVAIVETREPGESILLMRRADRAGDSWSGHWSFPGGRSDPRDPDALHTALRELEEECGIRLAREQLETAFPPRVARRGAGPFLMVAPFLFRVDAPLPTVLDPREAVEALWIPVLWLRDLSQHRLRAVPGRPANLLFPAIDLNSTPLWGFTYRLITAWLGLDPAHEPIEEAGLEAARAVLAFLLSHGLSQRAEWVERRAAVAGEIPVAAVLAHFSLAANYLPAVNALEVGADRVRMVGPAFEEYVISASA